MYSIAVKNLVYNSFGALINGLVLIVAAPIYLSIGGPELLGQVGFWMATMMLFQFLDFGSSITFTRALSQGSSLSDLKAIEKVNLISIASLVCLSLVTLLTQVYFKLDLSSMFMSFNPAALFLAIAVQLLFYFYSQGLIGIQDHRGFSLTLAAFSTLKHFIAIALLSVGSSFNLVLIVQFILMAIIAVGLRWSIYQRAPRILSGAQNKDARGNLKYSLVIMSGALISGGLATSDRFLATSLFSSYEAGTYLASFIVAGALSLIPLPFYRVYFPMFAASFKSNNMVKVLNDLLVSSALVTSITAIVGGILFLNAEVILFYWADISDPGAAKVIKLLLISFGLISFGWMPATLLQAAGFQNMQSLQMMSAIVIGCALVLIVHPILGIASVAAIWMLHGVIQICVCPIITFNSIGLTGITKWYLYSLAVPVVIVFVLLALVYIGGPSISNLTSSIAYFLSIILLFVVAYLIFREKISPTVNAK
ncbi:lipopolysaccharide biosynthesis protein [Porticoccaceae bacterium]|nr:lipopolysaccharide biosynthesis protein [Porticoccaceae bacterium]